MRARRPAETLPPGDYCEKVLLPRNKFVPETFEWHHKGKQHWKLIGCLRKDWRPRRTWRDSAGVEHAGKCVGAMQIYAVRSAKKPHRRCLGLRQKHV